MDPLSQHEAFLRAIFDAPDDDTPRLVYADFLEENGDPDRAAFIRYGCEYDRCPEDSPRREELQTAAVALVSKYRPSIGAPWPWDDDRTVRGLPLPPDPLALSTELIDDAPENRSVVVRLFPEWFGAKSIKLRPPPVIGPEQVATLLALPFTQQITDWDFGGHVEEVAAEPDTEDAGTFALIDMNVQPVITGAGVEALAQNRAARRIKSLTLTYNNLGNDAARSLVRSPYLVNLQRLDFREGNNLRGRVWQELLERFGENVVG